MHDAHFSPAGLLLWDFSQWKQLDWSAKPRGCVQHKVKRSLMLLMLPAVGGQTDSQTDCIQL